MARDYAQREAAVELMRAGRTCRSIAEEMELPLGTVTGWRSRHLHESKVSARFESGAFSETRGAWDVALGLDLLRKPWKEFGHAVA